MAMQGQPQMPQQGLPPQLMQMLQQLMQHAGQGQPQRSQQAQGQPMNPPAQVDPKDLLTLLTWLKQSSGNPQGPPPKNATQLQGPPQMQQMMPQTMQQVGQMGPPPQQQQMMQQQQMQQQQAQQKQSQQQQLQPLMQLLQALGLKIGQ